MSFTRNANLTAGKKHGLESYSEKIPRNGEDAISYSINGKASYVGVFDGVGGSGARRYESRYHKTGAYLASRLVAEEVKKWFDDGTNQSAGNTDLYLIPGSECEGTAETRLQNILQSKLRALSEKLSSSQKIKIKGISNDNGCYSSSARVRVGCEK